MKTLEEKIEIMKAALDGKEIDADYAYRDKWEATTCPSWNWHDYDYRIKPEPTEFWIDIWRATKGTKEIYLSMSGDKPEFNKEYDEIKKIKTIKVREVTE